MRLYLTEMRKSYEIALTNIDNDKVVLSPAGLTDPKTLQLNYVVKIMGYVTGNVVVIIANCKLRVNRFRLVRPG